MAWQFRVLSQSMLIADPADVTSAGSLRAGAQPLIQVDPTTGNLFTIGADGKATSSPEALDEAFANGVAVRNPAYSGPYSNSNPARLPGNWKDLYSASFKSTYSAPGGLKLLAVYHQSRDQRQYYDHSYLFNNAQRTDQAQRVATDMGLVGFDWSIAQSSKRSLSAQLRASYFKNKLDGGLMLLNSALNRNTIMGFGGDIGIYDEGETNRYLLYSAVSNDGFANDVIEPTALHPDLNRTYLWPTDQVTASNIFGATTPSRKESAATGSSPASS